MRPKLLLGLAALYLCLPVALFAQPRSSAPSPAVQRAPEPRFLFLDTLRADTMCKELSAAAARGYRVVAAAPARSVGMVMLLQKTADPADPYEYKLIVEWYPDFLHDELNFAGASGFRLHRQAVFSKVSLNPFNNFLGDLLRELVNDENKNRETPELFVLMEKAPGPRGDCRHQYQVIQGGPRFGEEAQPVAATAVSDGEETVAVLDMDLHGVYSILEHCTSRLAVLRRPGAAPAIAAPSPGQGQRELHFVFPPKKTAQLQEELNRGGKPPMRIINASGIYRYLLGLEEAGGSGEIVESVVLAEKQMPALEKKLNEAGARGFQLVPRSLITKNGITLVMEKTPGAGSAFEYVILQGKSKSAVGDQIEKAAGQGFQAVGLAKFHGFVVLLEKPGRLHNDPFSPDAAACLLSGGW